MIVLCAFQSGMHYWLSIQWQTECVLWICKVFCLCLRTHLQRLICISYSYIKENDFINIIVTCLRVAKRQLCERSDCETVSTSRQWHHVHRHLGSCCATLSCDVTQQRCHGDDSTVLSCYMAGRCWAIVQVNTLFTVWSVQRLYNDSSIQNNVVQFSEYSTVQFLRRES
jgi:hypothetical protein